MAAPGGGHLPPGPQALKVPPNEEPGTTNQKDEKVVVAVSQSTEHQSHRPEPNEDRLRQTGCEEHKVAPNSSLTTDTHDDKNAAAALSGSISRNGEELLDQDANSKKPERTQNVSPNQMESIPVQTLPTNDSSPNPPNQWLLEKRIAEATQESASIREDLKGKGMDKTEEPERKEYKKDDYSSHDTSECKANTSETTPSENQKENKGLFSSVVKGGKEWFSKITGRQASEEVDSQPVNEDEKKLGSRIELDFQAMCAARTENELVVKFEVLLASDFDFDPVNDKVVVKGLDVTRTDSWKSEGVEMRVGSRAPKSGPMEGITRLVGFTTLPKTVSGTRIPYKYQIVKNNPERIYEKLKPDGDYHNIVWNRVLAIPSDFSGESFEQVDDAILGDRSQWSRLEYRKKATMCFLPNIKRIIRDQDFLSLKKTLARTELVFETHTTGILLQRMHDKGYYSSTIQPALTGYDRACKEHGERLTTKIFNELAELIQQIEHSNGNLPEVVRLVEACAFLALYYVLCQGRIHRFLPELSSRQLDDLVTSLRPMLHEGKCLKLQAFEHILNNENKRGEIARTFEDGLNKIMKSRAFRDNPEHIISVFPTVHFLRGATSGITFREALGDTQKARFWGIFSLSTETPFGATRSRERSRILSVPVFEDMKAWSAVYPQLPVSFLKSLRVEDFLTVLANNDMADFWSLNILLAVGARWIQEDVDSKLTRALTTFALPRLSQLKDVVETLSTEEVLELELIMKREVTLASLEKYKSDVDFDSLCGILEMLASVLHIVFTYGEKKRTSERLLFPKMMINMIIQRVEGAIRGRATQKLQSLCKRLSHLINIFQPLKVVTDEFLTTALAKCQDEIDKSTDDTIIEVYTELNMEEVQPHIKRMIEEKALQVMDAPSSHSLIDKIAGKISGFFSGGSKKKDRIGLVERALRSSAKHLDLSDSFDVAEFVLSSKNLDKIIQYDLSEDLSPNGQQLVNKLMLSFGATVTDLVEGKAHVAMLKPFQGVNKNCLQSRIVHISKYSTSPMHDFQNILELRKQELEKYIESTTEVTSFLQTLNQHRNIDLTDAIGAMKTEDEIQSAPIGSLWVPRMQENQAIDVKIPSINRRAQEQVRTFMKYRYSGVFRNMSTETVAHDEDIAPDGKEEDGEEVLTETQAKMKMVLRQIVCPTVSRFEQMGGELKAKEIKLADVDHFFKEFKSDPDGLKRELDAIARTQDKPFTQDTFTKVWTRLQMSELKSTANMILRVKSSLGIETDFPEIKKIAAAGKEGGDFAAKLSSMSIEDARFGEVFKGWDNKDIQSIEELEKSQALVKWIQEHINNYQEFKFFVDLASISAGESDDEVDRVMFMQAAVTAYSGFIFDLNANSSLEDFMKACSALINARVSDPNLKEKLRDSNRHLPWIKTVKERHGSVETSSLQQVEAINRSGVYMLRVQNALSLNYQQVQSQEHGKEYIKTLSQEDLDELRSKLMLISKTSESKEIVDKFIHDLQMAERLKVAAKSLNEAGCNLYRKMIIKVFCDPDKKRKVEVDFGNGGLLFGETPLFEELPALATLLEKNLDDWSQHLKALRNKFSSLNFFRTDQLVELSETIAGCLNGKEISLSSKMLFTLMSRDVTGHEISEIFSTALAQEEESEAMEVVTFTADDIVEQLVNEHGHEEATAKASVMFYQNEYEITVLSDWCLENALEEELIEEFSQKYDELRKPQEQASEEQAVELRPTFSEYTKTIMETCEQDNFKLNEKMAHIWKSFLESVETEHTTDFINFTTLGIGLQILYERKSNNETEILNRSLPEYLTKGKPNLVVTARENIHEVALTIYNHDEEKRLPRMEEVLICNEDTSKEDVELICRRAFTDTTGRIFSILYAERLDFNTSYFIENLFLSANIENRDYKLVFICCKESVALSYLATAFDKYKSQIPEFKDTTMKTYLERHLKIREAEEGPEEVAMRMVVSERAGMGKSLQVQRISERSKYRQERVQLHDQNIDRSKLITRWTSKSTQEPTLYHVGITAAVGFSRNDLLFALVVLGGIQDSTGKVWACDIDKDMYMFEMIEKSSKEFSTLLPKTTCLSPQQSLNFMRDQNIQDAKKPIRQGASSNFVQLMDHKKFISPEYQRPANYILKFLGNMNLDEYKYARTDPPGSQVGCLELLLNPRACPIQDPSFAELTHFVSFLNFQLENCEKSIYCNQFQEDWQNLQFKRFVVKFMMHISKDFATRSLEISDQSDERIPEISNRRRWEKNPHPYIFFNNDCVTMSFFGICIDRDMNLVHPDRPSEVLEERIMTRNLYELLKVQSRGDRIPMFNMNFDNLEKQDKLRMLCRVLGAEESNLVNQQNRNGNLLDPDPSYKLTSDNVKKLLAIYMRLKTKIPVVCMGETGCGKTRMIQYLCDLVRGSKKDSKNMVVFKVHGGVTHELVKQRVIKAVKLAEENARKGIPLTVMFFDEANTTNAISSIKEVMIDRLIDGEPIPQTSTLQFICAVNPYRRHTDTMIKKLEGAGLGYHIRAENTKDTLGSIPLRQLVYRVHALPLSMMPLVWDFGSVSRENEKKYIAQMVANISENLRLGRTDQASLTNALQVSQEFMRNQEDECSFVSLRDVERALSSLEWFYSKINKFLPLMESTTNHDLSGMTAFQISFLLACGLSYHARLEKERDQYAEELQRSLNLTSEPSNILGTVVGACQDVFLNSCHLDSSIARNDALKENVWMMVCCIELKIPLFLVGKPGSSKSLAKTVVGDIMQGQNSYSDLFKNHFKEIHMVSFQCSPLASSEGIVGTFRQCQKYQQKKNLSQLTAVVILDEVGLAEDSPKMPLKALHPLLEDGCVDEDEPSPDKKVSFVGISNWALDPAKMNRGILLSRIPPDEKDLIKIGRGIGDKKVAQLTDPLIPDLVAGYLEVYNSQEREYFGLRDFYSLIKMLSAMVKVTPEKPSYRSVELCVKRNFGGYFGDFYPSDVFLRKMKSMQRSSRSFSVSEKELIEEALGAREKTNERGAEESRYMLLLTKNNAALRILQMRPRSEEQEIIFGSSFPKDQEYSQICANINRIKICMETGKQVVLCNLDTLYESLYDVLNQHYSYMGGNKYVDLGLGTHRVKCRVHENFRLILVAEDKDVYDKFPIPLINRLEKHYMGMETIMDTKFHPCVERLRNWVTEYCEVKMPAHQRKKQRQFEPGDVFIGYHDDVIPALILKLTKDDPTLEGEALAEECKAQLLLCATPDSVVRLPDTKIADTSEDVFKTYFLNQNHDSLVHFIQGLPPALNHLVQVTTHSRLLTSSAQSELAEGLGLQHQHVTLLSVQQFMSETEFQKKLEVYFQEASLDEAKARRLLIAQMDAGDSMNNNLVDCAKYMIQGTAQKWASQTSFSVLLVIHLPRVAGGCHSGYPGFPWQSVHIDELRSLQREIPMSVQHLKGRSIHQILKSEVEDDMGVLAVDKLVESVVTKSASMIKGDNAQRQIKRIDKFLKGFRSNGPFKKITLMKLVDMVANKEKSSANSRSWLSKMSLYNESLKEGNTFREAVWSHLQEYIAPSLAQLMATIDTNANLDLLESKEEWKIGLFMSIYREMKIPIAHSSHEVWIKTQGPAGMKFKLPFSWILVKTVNQCCNSQGGTTLPEEALLSTREGAVLAKAFEEGEGSIVSEYIADFIQLSVDTSEQTELEFISQMLYKGVEAAKDMENLMEGMEVIELDGESQETTKVPAKTNVSPMFVHSEFIKMREQVTRLTAILKVHRGILPKIQQKCAADKIPVDSAALLVALEEMAPDISMLAVDEERVKWENRVDQLQHLVEQMMLILLQDKSGSEDEDNTCKIMKFQWDRILVFKLFLHHVIPIGIEEDLKKALLPKIKMMWTTLKEPDMKTYSTFKNVIQILKIINIQAAKLHYTGGVNECVICGEIPKKAVALPCSHVGCLACLTQFMEQRGGPRRCPVSKCKQPEIPDDFEIRSNQDIQVAVEKHGAFRSTLNLFFMDLVENFCFNESKRPLEEKVFASLLNFVTTKAMGDEDKMGTKELSPFNEHGIDASPVIRSFILQLCMKSDREFADAHIETFLKHKARFFATEDEGIEMAQLYINCAEDLVRQSIYKGERNVVNVTATKANQILNKHTEFNGEVLSDLKTQDAIAEIRFALTVAASVLSNSMDNLSNQEERLLEEVVIFVANKPFAKEFLVKEICFKHRSDLILALKSHPIYRTLLPAQILTNEEQVSDMFLASGTVYQTLKNQLLLRVVDGNLEEFWEYLENNTNRNQIVPEMLLCLYFVTDVQKKVELGEEIRAKLVEVLEPFQATMYRMPKASALFKMIMEQQLGSLHIKNDADSPRSREIIKLAFCLRANLSAIERPRGLAELCSLLMFDPDSLATFYLPAMPHDEVYESLEAMRQSQRMNPNAKVYYCGKNHPYYIDDCGMAMVKARCVCGSEIGGADHQLTAAGNRPQEGALRDQTKRGYISVEGAREGLREQSAFDVNLQRLLIHLSLLAALVEKTEAVTNLTGSGNPKENLIKLIDQGIQLTSRQIGKSQDDILLLLFNIAANLKTIGGETIDLRTHALRNKTEMSLTRELKAVVARQDTAKRDFEAVRQKDESEGVGGLQMVLHTPLVGWHRLWRVRHQVNAENLLEWLQGTGQDGQAPTLVKFLKEAETLECLASLPQILQLHSLLIEKFDNTISLAELEVSIQDFIASRFEETPARLISTNIAALLHCWNSLLTKLQAFGGAALAHELEKHGLESEQRIDSTKASFIFPSSHGLGLCSFIVCRFLVETHNKLVDSNLPPISPASAALPQLAALTHVQVILAKSALIEYLLQVQSLLLANTRHILEGGLLREHYDIPSMERRIKDRFVCGRPKLIEGKLKQVTFLEDRSGIEQRLLSTRDDCPQQLLSNSSQHQIETEVRNLPEVCRLLDSVQTARDFLLETGGRTAEDLVLLLRRLHLYQGEGGLLSGGPLRGLKIFHVDHLIDFFWFVRAKRMIRNRQNVFEQVIPLAYCTPLPKWMGEVCKESLTRLPHAWLLPNLFHLIWTRLRTEPMGDTSNWPQWSLKEMLAAHVESGEEQCDQLAEEILLQHSVAFFHGLCQVVFPPNQ